MQLEEPRIWVVDDNRLDRERLCDALESLGRVETFADGESALRAAMERAPDLIVTDCVMPGLSGTELLEHLRAERPEVDVILVTAAASVEPAVAALRLGARDYLEKPVAPEALCHSVQQALVRRRLLAENARLREGLRTLEACEVLTTCLEPGEVYPLALDLALGAVGAPRGLALFRRTTPPQSHGVAFRGLGETVAGALRRTLVDEKGVDLDAFDSVALLDRGPILDVLREAGVDVTRLVSLPIRSASEGGGVLWLLEGAAPLDAQPLPGLGTVQRYAELALGNAERYAQAKERAFVDDVTELYNARYLHSALENEVRRASRYDTDLSVVFLDLDRFKRVNDRHGHLVGSQTLRRLAQMLADCLRQVDTLARYGGDEFTVVLADTGHEAALAVAERIRASVEAFVFESADGSPLRLTVSAGVSSYPEHGESREALLESADQAMYRGKSLGRNRVCSASDLGEGATGAV